MILWFLNGWIIFWLSAILSVVLFITHKKFYPVIYLISVALYIYSIGYTIEALALGRVAIQFILIFTAILFMVLGYYFSRIFRQSK